MGSCAKTWFFTEWSKEVRTFLFPLSYLTPGPLQGTGNLGSCQVHHAQGSAKESVTERQGNVYDYQLVHTKVQFAWDASNIRTSYAQHTFHSSHFTYSSCTPITKYTYHSLTHSTYSPIFHSLSIHTTPPTTHAI